ncbi:ImmA/IrrE family metallo-endopeptidase [Nocardioides marmoriginsengisoli]|uniref:ImmA/IrrE family metallo-endopeptidase n=1 Tax=Nocardioides marmoriginsengisoli TaxID=661483 RepID=A0A3N0CHG6_9ACTN|nr:ImmA/IrrE family metallo-endopeptidase [Nocardioides marmoriginsengisoli]RNL62701.1 ImmA/IrrE family metallo-endopeptidase [Nocardioides marmoriginsengisoli]
MINNPLPAGPAPDAAAIAERLRNLARCRSNPDLEEIASVLGVSSIRVDPTLDRLGHTTWTTAGPEIALQANQKATRQRFTLAHELAHIYLGHGRDGAHPHGQPYRDARPEERLADAIAGHLLVPSAEIRRLRDLTPNIADIREAAVRLGVSQAVVVRQLADADSTHHWLLINLKRTDRGGWHFWRVTGRIRGLSDKMRVADTEHPLLDKVPERDVPLQILTQIGDLTVQLQGTGNRRTNLTLMLVDHVRPQREPRRPLASER